MLLNYILIKYLYFVHYSHYQCINYMSKNVRKYLVSLFYIIINLPSKISNRFGKIEKTQYPNNIYVINLIKYRFTQKHSNGTKKISKNVIHHQCLRRWLDNQKITRLLYFHKKTRKQKRDFSRELFRKFYHTSLSLNNYFTHIK